MCDFMTAAAVMGALTAIVTSVQGAQQQRAQAAYADAQATAADKQTAWELNRRFERDSMALGNLQAQQAASGVAMSGSKSDLLLTASFDQAVDRDRFRLQGAHRASGLRADAMFRRSTATSLLVEGGMRATSSLLSDIDQIQVRNAKAATAGVNDQDT